MSFSQAPRSQSTPKDPIPSGMHSVICSSLVDMGTQPGSQMYPDPKRKLYITFEFPEIVEEFDGEMKPRVLGQTYNVAFGDKSALGGMLKNWFSDKQPDGDMVAWLDRECAGRPAMVNVTHNPSKDGSRIFANIVAVSPLPAKLQKDLPEQYNPKVVFEMFGKDFPQAEFDKIPEWLQKKIQGSPEYQKYFGEDTQPGFQSDDSKNNTDDLPF